MSNIFGCWVILLKLLMTYGNQLLRVKVNRKIFFIHHLYYLVMLALFFIFFI